MHKMIQNRLYIFLSCGTSKKAPSGCSFKGEFPVRCSITDQRSLAKILCDFFEHLPDGQLVGAACFALAATDTRPCLYL